MKYNITEIAKIVRADFRKNRECAVSVLLTDSRSLTFPEETLFFALVTERNDGHRYVFDLYRKGVCNFVVSRIPEHADEMGEANFLVVSIHCRRCRLLLRRIDVGLRFRLSALPAVMVRRS